MFDIGDKIDIFVNAIINVLSAFIVTPIQWFAKLAGFKPLNQIFFEGSPFSDREMDFILKYYWIVASVSSVFIIILAGKTAIKLMFSGITASERVSLTKEVTTWFIALLVIATAPWMLYLMFEFFSLLTKWLQSAINSSFSYTTNSNKTFSTIIDVFGLHFDESKTAEEIAQDNTIIDTFFYQVCGSNPANTIIMKALYLPLWAKINIVFMVRKYILGIFFLFTPVAILMWGIKRDSMLLNVWFGEILTNASMAFFYAFTYMATVHIFTAAGWTGWAFGFIAMYSIPKVADTLRNLLQNMFERWAGIDELNLARPALGSLSSMLLGFRNAFSALAMIRPTRLAESANVQETTALAPTQNRAVVVKNNKSYDDDDSYMAGTTTPPPYFGPTPRPSSGPKPYSGGGGVTANPRRIVTAAGAAVMAGATGGATAVVTTNAATGGTTVAAGSGVTAGQTVASFAAGGVSGKNFSASSFEMLRESSGTYKIDDVIDSVVFERIKQNPEYQQYFEQTGGLQRMLSSINKAKLFIESIKTGDTSKLEKEYGISSNTKHALTALHHIYKIERDLTLSQLGVHEVKTPNQKRYFIKPDFSEFKA